MTKNLCALFALVSLLANVNAQILLTDTFYTQNFNNLAFSGNANPISGLPTGWTFKETGFGADETYGTEIGTQVTGGTYSFGSTGNAERAFGGIAAGFLKTVTGVNFVNKTGKKVVAIRINYAGEHWRGGETNRNDSLLFQYQVGRSFAANINWINVPQLHYITNKSSLSSFTLDGNDAANRKELNYVIQNITIQDGDTLALRWTDVDISSPFDDGVGIDDFTITLYTADQFAPEYVSLTPASGSVLTDTFTTAVVRFSEPVKKGTGQISVKRISNGDQLHLLNINDPAVTITNAELSFLIKGMFRQTDYEIIIDSAAVLDTTGNAFIGIKPGKWMIAAISVTDNQPPQIDTLLPGKNTSISTNYINARIFFKENIQKGTTGKVAIRRVTDNELMVEFFVTDAAVKVLGNQLFFRSVFLSTGPAYYVTIDSGAIKDISNNVFPAVKKGDWNFSISSIFGIPPDNHALTINTLLPNNNAVAATPPSKLELYWYEYAIQQYGTINIRNVETDTIVQRIDVRSPAVQTSQLHTVINLAPLQNGNYYVEILPWNFINIPGTEYTGTTKTTWKFTVGTLTSVTNTNNEEHQLNIYGNPAGPGIYAGLNKIIAGKAEVVLINMAGVIVYRELLKDQRLFYINTSTFAKGMYLLKVNAGKYRFSEKIAIQ